MFKNACRRIAKLSSAALLLSLISIIPNATSAHAATQLPFTCSPNFYQVSATGSGALYSSSVNSSGQLVYTKFAGTPVVNNMNGIGYNTADNFIYGVVSNTLYRIDATGAEVSVGAVTGAPPGSPAAGDFVGPNELLVYSSGFFLINTLTRVSTAVTNTAASGTTGPVSGAWDFTVQGQYAYGLTSSGTTLVRVDVHNLQANPIVATTTSTSYSVTASTSAVTPNTNAAPTSGSGYGGSYADSDGNIYFYNNGDGKVFQISAASLAANAPKSVLMGGKATGISGSTGSLAGPNDGASCPKAANAFAPIATTEAPSQITTSSITFNGTVNPQTGGTSVTTTYYFCYSTSNSVDANGNLNSGVTCSPGSGTTLTPGSTVVSVSYNQTGLSGGPYYYQTKAVNASGTSYGAVVSVSLAGSLTYNGNGATQGNPPAQVASASSATVSGNTGNLIYTGKVFCGWSTNSSYAPSSCPASSSPGSGFYLPSSTITLSGAVTLYAVWISVNYTLEYNANGGTGTAPANFVGSGSTTLASNTFAGPAGFTVFAGWNTTADTTTGTTFAAGDPFTVTANATLYAKWVAATYTLTFDPGTRTGTTGGTVPSSIAGNGNVVLPGNSNSLTDSGFTFVGWNTNTNGTGTSYAPGDTFNLNGATTLYAMWAASTGTINFNDNGATAGAVPASITAALNTPITLDANPGGLVRPGYTFGGWTAVANVGPALITETLLSSSPVTLYALWNGKTNTLTYDPNGGTGSQTSQTSTYPNTTITLSSPVTVTNPGYTFAGWYKPSGLKFTEYQATGSPTDTAPDTATVAAQGTSSGGTWSQCATGLSSAIDYNWGTGSTGFGSCTNVDDFVVHWTGYLNIPDSSTATTVTFSDSQADGLLLTVGGTLLTPAGTFWKLAPGGQPLSIAPITLTSGQSTPIDVWFWEHQGGAAISLKWQLGGGVVQTIPASAFSTTSSLATSYFPGDTYDLIGDTTIYAKWKLNTYTLTYSSTGGGTVPAAVTGNGLVVIDPATNSMTPPSNLSGYVFAGWSTRSDGTGSTFNGGDSFDLRASVTLYATWAPATHTLTYDANNGDQGYAPPATVGYGDVTVSDNLYGLALGASGVFAGWNTAADGSGYSYLPGSAFKLDYDATLYAQYKQTVYTLTFNANPSGASGATVSGNVPDPEVGFGTVVLPGNTGLLTASGTPNYNFTGWWNTKADGTGFTYSPGDTFILDANTTLYAKWVSVAQTLYTLTFDGNGATSGVVPDPITGFGATALPSNTGNLLKTGFSFGGWSGWNTKPDGSGISFMPGDSFELNANLTLYAVWNAQSFTLSFAAGGATSGTVPNNETGYGDIVLPGNDGGLVNTSSPNFVGWTPDNGTTVYNAGDIFTLETDTVMTAVWTASTLYTLTYDANSSAVNGATISGAVPDPVLTDGTVTLASNIYGLSAPGFNLVGWTIDSTNYNAGDTYTVAAAKTAYALWSPIQNTITYDANGATSGTVPTGWTGYGTTTISGNTGNLVLSGYTFAGWNDEADGSGTTYSSSQTINLTSSSLYLYALWQAPQVNTGPSYFIISFNGNGNSSGSAPSSIPNIVGTPLGGNLPGNSGGLSKTGFTFGGWSLTQSGQTPLTGTYVPASSVTLYAIWIPVVVAPTPTPTPAATPAASPAPSPTPSESASSPSSAPTGSLKVEAAPKQVVPNQIVPVKEVVSVPETNASVKDVLINGKRVAVTATNPSKIVLPTLVGPSDKVVVQLVEPTGKVENVKVVEAPTPISLANVNFDLAKFSLTPAAKSILDKVASVVIAKGFTHVDLVGHTDSLGVTVGYDNQTLSEERAKEAEKYLQSKLGNRNVVITVDAKAHIDPIASNATPTGQALNRRVEITVH